MALKLDHLRDKSQACTFETEYELNHVLLLLIQKTTGQQTHEIMSNVLLEFNIMMKEHGIDLTKKTAACLMRKNWDGLCYWTGGEKRKRKYIKYLNTAIAFNISVVIRWTGNQEQVWTGDGYRKCKTNCNYVKIKINLPQKTIKFDDKNMSLILAEGDLLDFSDDIEDVKLKGSLTVAEKQAKEKQKKLKTKTDSKKR
jgi:hypothetical protein